MRHPRHGSERDLRTKDQALGNSSDKVKKEKEHPDRGIKKKQKDTEKQAGKPVTKSTKDSAHGVKC